MTAVRKNHPAGSYDGPPDYRVIGRHALFPQTSHDEVERINFLAQMNRHLAARVVPGVRSAYETRVEPAFEARHGRKIADRHEARNRLHAATFHLDALSKIRLLGSRQGALAIEIRPLFDIDKWRVAVVSLPVASEDFRLRHKTSDRAFYDETRKARTDCDEVVFVGGDGRLTEGSISALFVEQDGKLLTPRLETGLLPSVLRRELIEAGRAEEADLTADDLANGFFMGNSVRGLIRANRVA